MRTYLMKLHNLASEAELLLQNLKVKLIYRNNNPQLSFPTEQ